MPEVWHDSRLDNWVCLHCALEEGFLSDQRLQPVSPEGTNQHCSGLLTHAQELSGCPCFATTLLQEHRSCFQAAFDSPLASMMQ